LGLKRGVAGLSGRDCESSEARGDRGDDKVDGGLAGISLVSWGGGGCGVEEWRGKLI